MQQSIERVHLSVAGVTHHLSPLEDPAAVKEAVLRAIRLGGDFVEVILDSGQHLSLLTTSTTSVVVAVETVTIAAETADREADIWRPESFWEVPQRCCFGHRGGSREAGLSRLRVCG